MKQSSPVPILVHDLGPDGCGCRVWEPYRLGRKPIVMRATPKGLKVGQQRFRKRARNIISQFQVLGALVIFMLFSEVLCNIEIILKKRGTSNV